MNAFSAVGLLLVAAGVLAYVLGVSNPYPGRAFSITLVMAGVTLLAVRNVAEGTEGQ